MILSYVKSLRGKTWRGAGDLGVNLKVLQTIKEGKRIYASAGQVRRQASGWSNNSGAAPRVDN